MDFSWLIPYTSGLLNVDSACLKYLTRRRDSRQWLGMIESLVAISYLRFRPGAKININGFKISNDNSHHVSLRDYKDEYGREGFYASQLKVYGKKNAKKNDTPDGRKTYWFPDVQK